MKLATSTFLAVALASGAAFAQAMLLKTPAADAAVDAKFKAADKNNNGSLDGAELDTYKADFAKIDTDKDGKISSVESASATKSGIIK